MLQQEIVWLSNPINLDRVKPIDRSASRSLQLKSEALVGSPSLLMQKIYIGGKRSERKRMEKG